MMFTPDDFVTMEAQRQALVQQYTTQRDERRAREKGAAMTEDELQAIEARANAATPGPWEVEQKDCTVLRAPNGPPADQSLMGDEQYYPWTPDRIEDWQFIASARTDVPALVAEVRRLRALCRRGGELLNAEWYDAPAGTISDVKALAGDLEVAGRE
jgi:hypothetical protein